MLNYTVCTTSARYGVSPTSLTPGFPSLFGFGEGQFVVLVQPLHLLPDGEQIEGEIARDEVVHVPREGLAVVEFCHHEGVNTANDCRVAADRWCRFAILLGWRVWLLPEGGGLPLQEVGEGKIGEIFFGQGTAPKVVLAKRSLTRPILSSIHFPNQSKDAA